MEKMTPAQAAEFYERCLDKSINYNNAIISIGYLSFFTVLLLIKDGINSNVLSQISTCTLWSLFFYLFWVVGSMIYNSISLIKMCWSNFSQKAKRVYMVLWPVFLILTILPMIYAFILLLLGIHHYLIN